MQENLRLRTQLSEISVQENSAKVAQAVAEEREEERQRARASFINSLPTQVESMLSSIKTIDDVMPILARLAEIFKTIDEGEWLWLRERTPFEAPVSYSRLRATISPRLGEWWQLRESLQPSPIPMLKIIAASLLYTDFDGIAIANNTLPKEIATIEQELSQSQSARQTLLSKIDRLSQSKQKATDKVASAEHQLSDAVLESQKPLDANKIAIEAEKQLKGIGCGGIVAFVVGTVMMLGFLIGLLNQDRTGTTFDVILCFVVFVMPPLGFGIYRAIKAHRMRSLSVEEFKAHLDQRSQGNIERATVERQNAVTTATSLLAKSKEQLEGIEREIEQNQAKLPALDAGLTRLTQRRKEIPGQMLHGRVDMLFKSILES